MSHQLSIYDARSDDGSLSLQNNRSDAKTQALYRFCNNGRKSPTACVNTYSPGRRTAKYFRLSYETDGKKKHIHIRGGNTKAKLALYRANVLQTMIDRGAELNELIAVLSDFNSGAR